MSIRKINARGEELIKHFESLYLKAYKCPGGAWTIGWGHTGLKHNDGTVKAGRTITQPEAQLLFEHDMAHWQNSVARLVTVPLSDDEFAALVSFDFNTGALHKSTLLKKLNKGDRAGAAAEFLKWNKADGKVLRGLTRRRKSEQNLFNSKTPFIVPA